MEYKVKIKTEFQDGKFYSQASTDVGQEWVIKGALGPTRDEAESTALEELKKLIEDVILNPRREREVTIEI